jgi:hypothetical protein
METSASFEARSAPSPYPAANLFNKLAALPRFVILDNFCTILSTNYGSAILGWSGILKTPENIE